MIVLKKKKNIISELPNVISTYGRRMDGSKYLQKCNDTTSSQDFIFILSSQIKILDHINISVKKKNYLKWSLHGQVSLHLFFIFKYMV